MPDQARLNCHKILTPPSTHLLKIRMGWSLSDQPPSYANGSLLDATPERSQQAKRHRGKKTIPFKEHDHD